MFTNFVLYNVSGNLANHLLYFLAYVVKLLFNYALTLRFNNCTKLFIAGANFCAIIFLVLNYLESEARKIQYNLYFSRIDLKKKYIEIFLIMDITKKKFFENNIQKVNLFL